MISIANRWDLLHDARAVELVAMALEHQPDLGVTLQAGADRLSAWIGAAAYARVGGQLFESDHNVTWEMFDDLEDHKQGWAEVMVQTA
jgi:hypothetical protein